MERLSYITSALPGGLQEQAHGVYEVIRSHPWIAAGVVVGTTCLSSYLMTPRNLPPGPMNFPVIGAVSCLGSGIEYKMLNWKEKYGDIISFYKNGRVHVMLNSERAIRDAFVKNPEDFSDRSHWGPLSFINLGSVPDEIFGAEYNEQWKKNKRFAVSSLKTFGFGTANSEEKFQLQLNFMLDVLLKSNGAPIDISKDCKILAAGVISSILFSGGTTWADPESTTIAKFAEKWLKDAATCLQMVTMAYDFLPVMPIIRNMLIFFARRKVTATQLKFIDFVAGLMKSHRNEIGERESQDVVDAYLKERGADDAMIERFASTIVIFMPDAIDTTGNIDMWCLIYATLHLDAQRKMQSEIDQVCGESRLPTIADRAKMPYTQAFIYEVLRVNLIIPMSFPREIKREGVTLDGYSIPKGAQVIANFHSINFDPQTFPDPFKFKPSRFITSDGTFNSSLGGRIMSFSVGPRMCIGDLYVKAHIFFFLARILQRFNVVYDPNGPRPTTEGDPSSFMTRPMDVKVCFMER